MCACWPLKLGTRNGSDAKKPTLLKELLPEPSIVALAEARLTGLVQKWLEDAQPAEYKQDHLDACHVQLTYEAQSGLTAQATQKNAAASSWHAQYNSS